MASEAVKTFAKHSKRMGTFEDLLEGMNGSLEKVRRDCLVESDNQIDVADPDLDFTDRRFNGRYLMEQLQDKLNMTEAVAYSTLSQVARYGVLKEMIDAYQRISIIWREIATIVPSKTYSEFFAPIYETDIPNRVELLEEADESRLVGLNVEIINHEYARIIRVPKVLVRDDQTGQILTRATGIGSGMGYAEEMAVIDTYVNHGTYTTNAASDINQLAIENGWIALRKVKDPLNNFLVVTPDTIICDVTRELTTRKLLESISQPSVPFSPTSSAASPTAATAAQPGYFMTTNVLKGMFNVLATPFIAQEETSYGADGVSPKWYLSQAKKGVYFTDREPLEVVQEDPNAGTSWSTRSFAWQATRRFGAGIVDDKFIFAGNG